MLDIKWVKNIENLSKLLIDDCVINTQTDSYMCPISTSGKFANFRKKRTGRRKEMKYYYQ